MLVDRYEPEDPHLREHGISEARPLDFHSPYGCSKGTADQYVIDYARTFGLPAAVFRMSCIYGPHQFGTEDQGWVAHFLIRAIQGKPITLYGGFDPTADSLHAGNLVLIMTLAHFQRHGQLGPHVPIQRDITRILPDITHPRRRAVTRDPSGDAFAQPEFELRRLGRQRGGGPEGVEARSPVRATALPGTAGAFVASALACR